MAERDLERVLGYGGAERPGRQWAWWGVVVVLTVVLVWMLGIVRDGRRTTVERPQVRCASNLRQIGQAAIMYAAEGDGGFAGSFAELLETQQISSGVFVCRMATEQKAQGRNVEETAWDFARPGRCSYVYVGAGLRLGGDPDAIVAFEDPANHAFAAVNVLYGDGHVNALPMAAFMVLLEDLGKGVNPPTAKARMSEEEAVKVYEAKWRGRMAELKRLGLKVEGPKVEQVEGE